MPDSNLARKNLERYEKLGFIGPIKAFNEAEMHEVAQLVLREHKEQKGILSVKRNRHLDWDAARRLTIAPAIVDIATQILGPELILWRTNFFVGDTGKGIRWHQDEYRTLLSDPLHQISIHLGITEAQEDNCIMVIPGSHKMTFEELAEQGFSFIPGSEKGSYGTPGFWRHPEYSLNKIKMVLRAGEFFVFHPRLLHASYDLTAPPSTPPGMSSSAMAKAQLFTRVGFALRITVPENKVLPAAFAETISRGDKPVKLVTPTGIEPVLRP